MQWRIIRNLLFSIVLLCSFVLGVGLLGYLSAPRHQIISAPRTQLSLSEAVEHQLKVLQRFHQGCSFDESRRFNDRLRIFTTELRGAGGNPFLLYAYTEIYTLIQREELWELAKKQAECLESDIAPYIETKKMHLFPKLQRAKTAKRESFTWGTYLHALAYFHQVNDSRPAYLEELANFLLNLDTSYSSVQELQQVAQAEERRVRGLLRYYDLSTQAVYLERAEEVLRAIDVPPSRLGSDLPSSPYVMAKYLRAYCELYSRHPHDWLLRRIEEFTQAVEAFMEFLRTNPDEGLIVLVYYQMAVAADACWEATSEERFMHLLRETLTKEIANISVESGIIEKGERITLSLNAEITRLLVKYGSKLISTP